MTPHQTSAEDRAKEIFNSMKSNLHWIPMLGDTEMKYSNEHDIKLLADLITEERKRADELIKIIHDNEKAAEKEVQSLESKLAEAQKETKKLKGNSNGINDHLL